MGFACLLFGSDMFWKAHKAVCTVGRKNTGLRNLMGLTGDNGIYMLKSLGLVVYLIPLSLSGHIYLDLYCLVASKFAGVLEILILRFQQTPCEVSDAALVEVD